jgi:hypothetical protein
MTVARSGSSTRRSAADDDGKVTLALAHPISEGYLPGLGVEPTKDGNGYAVGEDISVAPQVARAIINAGFAQVDPENPEHVAKALGISDEEAEGVVKAMAGENPPRPVVDA